MVSQSIALTVLDCVRLEGGFTDAKGMADLALVINRDKFSASDLHLAVTECIAQGWIKVLTHEGCQADAARWKDQPHQDMIPYQEGSIDFTQSGWEVYATLYSARYGGDIENLLSGSTHYLWDTPGQVSLIATTESTILENIAKIQSGEDDPIRTSLDADYQIAKIVGPYSIGPWWFNRFYQAPQAFRADISYNATGA